MARTSSIFTCPVIFAHDGGVQLGLLVQSHHVVVRFEPSMLQGLQYRLFLQLSIVQFTKVHIEWEICLLALHSWILFLCAGE